MFGFGHHGHHGQNAPAPAAAGGNQPTFKIFCKADEGYCLSVRDGNVVLAPSNPRDEHQHWFKDMRFSTQIKDEEGNPAFAIVNKATGLAVKHSLGQSHPVKLVPFNPEYLDESVMWTESGDVGKGFRCIRMVNNIRLNFDALNGDKDHGGVHDGTTVVLWEWAKGDNQSWKILPWGEEAYANAPRGGGGSSEPTVRIFCKADEGFSATVRNGAVVLAPTNPRDEHQHWFKDMRHSNRIKDEEGYPAFALVNKVTPPAAMVISHASSSAYNIFSSRYAQEELPRYRMPENSIPKEAAYQMINDELMLDGNPRLEDLASFVTTWMEPPTWMEPGCDKLIMDSVDKNYVDMDEYPVTTELELL